MKKYTITLTVITIVLVVASFAPLWANSSIYHPVLSALPLYFAIINGMMHYSVLKSFNKDYRTFVKNFLGITVGSLFLHLVVLFLWAFTHIATAKIFIIGFFICYATYLIFETIMLILMIRDKRREASQE